MQIHSTNLVVMISIKVLVILTLLGFVFPELSISKSAFMIWRQNVEISQKNHIKIRFKTIDASGLILLAQGANKKDYLSMELYRGKIRVAANQGTGTANSLRPIPGHYEMFLGKDLADNEWHTVELIRNIRENLLFIDRGTPREKQSFVKSPPTYTELGVALVAFGGFYSFDPSEIEYEKSLSRKGIKGCFTTATFSQSYPASQELEFAIKTPNGPHKHGVISTIGEVENKCQTPPYSPLYFPSSAVHLALKEVYKMDGIKMSLKFRTVIADQTVANYTHKRTGERLSFRLDRQGRITLNLDMKTKLQSIQTTRGDYHDGEWHSASFLIDNKLNVENNYYLMEFTVDGKTRLSSMSSKFILDGAVHIGFGFTGCMRNVEINDQPIDKVTMETKDPAEKTQFFSIYDIGVQYGACSLKDYCSPNPCQNGGKCNQTEDNIVCNCRDTLYEGSTCHRARFNYTCAGVREKGERRSDVYYIDFDGMGPMEPVKALCDLGKTIETTTTQINNTKYEDKDVTTDSGSNKVEMNYAANIVQMRELILNSEYCEQYIKFQCKGAALFRSPEGPPATSWMGGDDIMHYYWGGAHNQRGYCACGVQNTCRNNKKYCNCDDLDAYNNVHDEGNFTIKEHLPVRAVKFTSVLRAKSLNALLMVGHLRCTGFGARNNAATFRKPWSFLSVDHPDQPFDKIAAGGVSFDFKTSLAYNYMVVLHAHGPFSGDFLKVVIISTTLMRVYLNAGFGTLKQDVDISATGRTINDNTWHEFSLMFNMKELNVTLDGVEMIQGLPLQEDPFQFTVDGKPVYVGGSYYDKHGFIGCIRSLYINGRIHNVKNIARGQEDFGVYPGCGSACMLLPKACNYGYCIDEYNSFKCNCTVSPNDGRFCGNESYPKQFNGGQFATYDLERTNLSEPIAEAIITVGFKTSEPDVALAQVTGESRRHFSLALLGGYLTLLYSTKERKKGTPGLTVQQDMETMKITEKKLSNDQHHVVRIRFSTQEVYLSVVDYGLEQGENITERFIDANNKNKGKKIDVFGKITSFTVGKLVNENNMIDTRIVGDINPFTGCMSGGKLVFIPHVNKELKVRTSIEVDMFKEIEELDRTQGGGSDPNPTGPFPTKGERCGPTYPTPGVLPTVGPPIQFFTKSPGLDISVNVVAIDTANQAILMVVILVVAFVLLFFLYLIYKKVNVNNKTYNEEKRNKYDNPVATRGNAGGIPKGDKEQLMKSAYPPAVGSNQPGGGQGGSGWKSPDANEEIDDYDDYL